MPPGIAGSDPPPLVVLRRGPDEPLGPGPGEREDGALETEAGKLVRLAGARPEAGPPEQPLSLATPKDAAIARKAAHAA